MQLWKKVRYHFTPMHENAYRPKMLGRTSLIIFLGLSLAVEGFLAAGLVARESDGTFLAAVISSDIVTLTNGERVRLQLGPLHENALLNAAAQAKASDMALKGYFAHVSPDGSVPWMWITTSGYNYLYAGENLAVRFNESKDVVHAWMDSPSHRANILKPVYSDIGVGTATGVYKGNSATFVVQYFASSKTPIVEVQNSAALPYTHFASSFAQLVSAETFKFISNPVKMNWILGGIATILVLTIGLALVLHMDIVARDMLLGGAVVAAIALLCLGANRHFLPSPAQQVATVIESSDAFDSQFITNILH